MSDKASKSHEDAQEAVLTYAVNEIKETVKDTVKELRTDIKDVKDCVTKIEGNLGTYALRTTNLEEKVKILEPQVDKAKGYMNRIAGALVVISVILQLVVAVGVPSIWPPRTAEKSKATATARHEPSSPSSLLDTSPMADPPPLTTATGTNGNIELGKPK